MKRSILYTAVFSAMLMVTGCGGGDGSSTSDDKGQSTQLDTSPIKKNQLYSVKIGGVSSYYVDDGQNQVSYFHENGEWYGAVENKDGKTNFSFSDDLSDFTASNKNQNLMINIKKINENVIYQTLSDLNGENVNSLAYFREEGKIFIAPLKDGEIDRNNKEDITLKYNNLVNQLEQENTLVKLKVDNIIHSISAKTKNVVNEIMLARSPTQSLIEKCSSDNIEDELNAASIKWVGSIILGVIAIPVVAIGVPYLAGATLGVATATGVKIIIDATAVVFFAEIFSNKAKASDIDPNNLEALKKLGITKEEIDNEWKKFLDEAKKCQAEGSVMVNGVCKKEEEPQCLADEILVNGICKKKEPVCLADEILINGVCKKQEPKCATDEVLVNGVCKKEEPQCLADEILVNGICKKKEPICATDEILKNGQCIKLPVASIGFTKISSTGKKLDDGATEWDCVLDNETGLMWERKLAASQENVRDERNTYAWYENTAIGYPTDDRYVDGFTCGKLLSQCNSKTYISAINSQKTCGYSNWRIPNKSELIILGQSPNREKFFKEFRYLTYMTNESVQDGFGGFEYVSVDFYGYKSNMAMNGGWIRAVRNNK